MWGMVALSGCGSRESIVGSWKGELSLAPAKMQGMDLQLDFRPNNTVSVMMGGQGMNVGLDGRYELRGTALTLLDLDRGIASFLPGNLRSMGGMIRIIDMQVEWHGSDEFYLRGNAAFAGTYHRVKNK